MEEKIYFKRKHLQKVRVLRILLCLGLAVLLFAGCKKENSKERKLIILQSKVEIHDSFQALLQEYEKETGIETVLRTYSGDAYTNSLNSTITNEGGPVIFSTGGYVNTLQYKEFLENQSSAAWVQHVIDEDYLTPVKEDGKVYGYPFNVEAFGILYNADLLEEAGVHADEIKTLQQFDDCLQKLSEICENPISLGFGETWIPGLHITNMAFGHLSAPEQFMEDLSEQKITLTDTKTFLDMVKVLDVLKKNTTEEIVTTDYIRQITSFANGKCAMILNGSWAYSAVKNLNPDLNIHMMGLPFNEQNDIQNQQFPKGITTFLCINNRATDKQKELAQDFLDWLTFSPKGKRYIMETEEFVSPFYRTALKGNPVSSAVAKQEGLPFVYMNYPPGIGMKDWGASIQKYMDEKITKEELLHELETAWTR